MHRPLQGTVDSTAEPLPPHSCARRSICQRPLRPVRQRILTSRCTLAAA